MKLLAAALMAALVSSPGCVCVRAPKPAESTWPNPSNHRLVGNDCLAHVQYFVKDGLCWATCGGGSGQAPGLTWLPCAPHVLDLAHAQDPTIPGGQEADSFLEAPAPAGSEGDGGVDGTGPAEDDQLDDWGLVAM